MPICTRCDEEKALNEFFMRNNAKNIPHKQCKQCYNDHRKSYYKQHYAKYRTLYLKRATIRRRAIKTALQMNMLEYLQDKSCELCGISDIRVLDFDHIDPSLKTFSIARGITDGRKWEALLAEIKKCRILCANCHRIRTAEQYKWYRMAR